MKLKFVVITSLLFMTGSSVYGDTGSIDDLLGAGEGTWGDEVEAPAAIRRSAEHGTTANTSVETDVTLSAPVSCTRKDQTSIPQGLLEKMFLSRKKLIPKHDPKLGLLSLNGGSIKSNCVNMLSYNWSYPKKNNAYAFQAEISKKKATNCRKKEIEISKGVKKLKEVCTFKAYTANNGVKNDELMDVEVEPNLYGFIQCMKDTGALTENGWDNSKTAKDIFNPTLKKAFQTNKLQYNCFGPECAKYAKSKRTAKTQEYGCRTLEYIKENNGNNFTAYSEEDIELNQMKAELDTLCSQSNYKLVEKRLPDFKEFGFMYKILLQARNNMIIHQAKGLKKDLAKRGKNLSKVKIAKYNEVLTDFYTKIIEPLKKRILKGVDQIEGMEDGPRKTKLQNHLNTLVSELLSYRKNNFLTKADYKKMKDFAHKAPLDSELWRETALITFAINDTAANLARYNPKFRKSKKGKKGFKYLNIDEVQDLIENRQADEADDMNNIAVLAEDKEGAMSVAAGFEREANMVRVNYQNQMRALQNDMVMLDRVSSQCSDAFCYQQNMFVKSQIGRQMQAMGGREYQAKLDGQVNHFRGLANKWKPTEVARNSVYKVDPKIYNYNYQRIATPEQMRRPNGNREWNQRYQQFQRSQYPVNPNDPVMADAYSRNLQGRELQLYALERQQQQRQYDLMRYGNNNTYQQNGPWRDNGYRESSWNSRRPAWQSGYENSWRSGSSFRWNFN